MKKLFLILFAGLLAVGMMSCNSTGKADKNFTLNVTVKNGMDGALISLKDRKDAQWVTVDSAFLKEGKVSLSGNIDSPQIFYVFVDNVRGAIPVFVEKGTIAVNADTKNLRNATIEGSKSNEEYHKFMNDVMGSFDKKIRELGSKYGTAQRSGDTAAMKRLEDEYAGFENDRKQAMLDYAKNNNTSVVGTYIIFSNSYMFDLNELEKAADSFDKSIQNTKYAKLLKERVATLKRVEVGQPYVDFTLKDPTGKPISLKSVVDKNKYVLVDFWASWCQPCRGENPNVVEAFKKYHDKGFTVFGVSFDDNKDNWVKAIKDDNLTWLHVSDLKGWGNAAGKLYGVQSIPQNILIGPEGTIIAKNVRGQELQDKLKELMD